MAECTRLACTSDGSAKGLYAGENSVSLWQHGSISGSNNMVVRWTSVCVPSTVVWESEAKAILREAY